MKTKKTTLTVELEYDPAVTDPESLACAMDRLLETALSTPDIMDDYKNPKVGEFFVANEPTAPPKPKIVLNISGGTLQDVFGSPTAIDLIAVDWDTEGCAPADDGIVEIPNGRGGTQLAVVAKYPVLPLTDLACTDAEQAIKAAGLGQSAAAGETAETTQLWVIYDFDMKELATTTAYQSYEEAAADANELNNVLVLPMTIEGLIV